MEHERKKSFHSLRTTLTIAFLALSLFVLVLSSSLQLYSDYRTQERSIFNQQRLIAEDAAKTVRSFIDKKITTLQTAAALDNIAGGTMDDEQLALNKLLMLDPAFRQVSLMASDGKGHLRATRLSSFAASDLNIMMSPEALMEMKRDGVFMSEVYFDQTTSEPLLVMAVPVHNALNETIGHLAAEINLKTMWDIVDNIHVGESGLVYVVNDHGDLLAFRDTSRVLRKENLATLYEVIEFMENPIDDKAVLATGIMGTRVITTHVPLLPLNWAVIIETPTGEAYAPLKESAIRSLLIILASSLLVLAISLFFSRKIITPVSRLRDAAEAISGGNLDILVPVESEDEIGEVAEAFNSMTKQMREYYRSLEEKVEERTKAMNEKVDELERANKFMVDRELKMVELKKEIERLKASQK